MSTLSPDAEKKIRAERFKAYYGRIEAMESSISQFDSSKIKIPTYRQRQLKSIDAARTEHLKQPPMDATFVPEIKPMFTLLEIRQDGLIAALEAKPFSDGELLFQLKCTKVALESIRSDIALAQKQYDKLKSSDQTLLLTELEKVEELTKLEKQCAAATAKLALPPPTLESKAATESAQKNKRGFLLFKLFNKDNKEREEIKRGISAFQSAMPVSSDANIPLPKSNETQLSKAAQEDRDILSVTSAIHEKMQKKFSTENLSFKALKGITEQLTRHISATSKKLDRYVTSDKTPQEIFDCLRELNTQIEALNHLAEIAKLKIEAPSTSRLHISESQAQELQKLFSSEKSPFAANGDFIGVKAAHQNACTKLTEMHKRTSAKQQ